MNFDATVNIGTLLGIGGAVVAIITAIVVFAITKLSVSKGDWRDQLAELKTDLNTDIGRISSQVTLGLDTISKQASERHDRSCRDFDRIEKQITEALAEAKAANLNAITAFQAAQRAELVASNTEKNNEAAIVRQDRQIESLQNRQRRGDT